MKGLIHRGPFALLSALLPAQDDSSRIAGEDLELRIGMIDSHEFEEVACSNTASQYVIRDLLPGWLC